MKSTSNHPGLIARALSARRRRAIPNRRSNPAEARNSKRNRKPSTNRESDRVGGRSNPADARNSRSNPAGARNGRSNPADARNSRSSPADARRRRSNPADARDSKRNRKPSSSRDSDPAGRRSNSARRKRSGVPCRRRGRRHTVGIYDRRGRERPRADLDAGAVVEIVGQGVDAATVRVCLETFGGVGLVLCSSLVISAISGDARVVLAVQVAFPSGAADRSVVLVDYQTVVVVLVVAQTLWGCIASVHLLFFSSREWELGTPWGQSIGKYRWSCFVLGVGANGIELEYSKLGTACGEVVLWVRVA